MAPRRTDAARRAGFLAARAVARLPDAGFEAFDAFPRFEGAARFAGLAGFEGFAFFAGRAWPAAFFRAAGLAFAAGAAARAGFARPGFVVPARAFRVRRRFAGAAAPSPPTAAARGEATPSNSSQGMPQRSSRPRASSR